MSATHFQDQFSNKHYDQSDRQCLFRDSSDHSDVSDNGRWDGIHFSLFQGWFSYSHYDDLVVIIRRGSSRLRAVAIFLQI